MSGYFLFIHINESAPVESPDTIPISQAYILAHLKAHGFSGDILGDFLDRPLKPGVLAKAINTQKPLALGFSAYQENIERVRLWARYAKSLDPNIRIILGGPQVTFMPVEALRHMPEVDFLCTGEGEEVMLQLAYALSEGKDLSIVPGLRFLREDQAVETAPAYGATDLDQYPSPYLTDLIDLQHKHRVIILTSRGCPFDCAFCYTPKASRRIVRFHSIERIIEEMNYVRSKGINDFWFADPNFSCSQDRLVSLLNGIIEDVPGISFWCQTRYDLVNPEMLALLKQAGAHSVAYGLESASPNVLQKINKRMDLERLSGVIHWTQEAGINVELFTMFGLPGETVEDAFSTVDYVKNHGVLIRDNSVSQQAHLFFGAPMTEDPSAYGMHPLPRIRPAYLSICRDFETDTMSKDQIWQVAVIWRLNHRDFIEDIETERNLFNRAGFIIRNQRSLTQEPLANYLLTRIYLALEEYEAASTCIEILKEGFPEHTITKEILGKPFMVFKKKRGPAALGDQAIYDCQGFINGEMIPATCGRYQIAVLGDGGLLPDFEEGLKGLRPRHVAEFPVSFPADYGLPELAEKTVRFRVTLHQVMAPMVIERFEDLGQAPKNKYHFTDTEGLRKHNEKLYYLVLRDTTMRGLSDDLGDYLNLIDFYLKLGFTDRGLALADNLLRNPALLGYVAHILRINGLPQKALEVLSTAGRAGDDFEMIRAECLFDLKRWDEAEKAVSRIYTLNQSDVRLSSLEVKLAIERNLPVEEYLKRFDTFLDAQIESMLS
jgi:anaerobic magnesium-protoporphyrin IX monomethyl ester cyclase